MNKIYPCPHCRTQNFATQARLRKAGTVPLKCWRCGKEIKEPFARLNHGKNREKRDKSTKP